MVKNVLDTVCYHLPHSMKNECEKLVSEYTNIILDMIVNSMTPEEVRTRLQNMLGTRLKCVSVTDL